MNDDSLCNDFTYLLWSDKTGGGAGVKSPYQLSTVVALKACNK